mgnify:CR=1 FL=1
MDSVITASGLMKRYRGKTVVDHVSLAVGRGEIYGLIGLNGAGKTTTLRMLLGMIKPSGGTARVLGVQPSAGVPSLWKRVGYLVEAPHAYPELTVRENLEVFRRLRRVADRYAVERSIERLGLTPYADRPARTLSLGNARRLGLAKALLHEPEVLILDEPANGLDPAGVVEVRRLLLRLAREQGVTVFMSSHILSEVARLATRVGVIHQGRLLEELNAEELGRRRHRWLVVDARDRRAARAILAGAGFAVDAAGGGVIKLVDERAVARPDHVARLLVEAGVPPTRLSVEQEDLETYFLRLVGAEKGVGSWTG